MMKPTEKRSLYDEGGTLGYRMLYGYFPKDDLVIAVGTNSQPPDKQNRIGALLGQIYTAITYTKNGSK